MGGHPRARLLTCRGTRSTSGPPMPRRGCPSTAPSTGCARSTATNPGTTNCAPKPSITAALPCTPTRRTIQGCSSEKVTREEQREASHGGRRRHAACCVRRGRLGRRRRPPLRGASIRCAPASGRRCGGRSTRRLSRSSTAPWRQRGPPRRARIAVSLDAPSPAHITEPASRHTVRRRQWPYDRLDGPRR